MKDLFDTPAVVVLYDTAVQNVKNMINGLNNSDIAHRPHIKVHKSVMLAKMQLELGAKGITCAKVSEAEAMADGGATDILIANEIIGELKLKRLTELCKKADVTVCVDSAEGGRQLSEAAVNAGIRIKAYIEINVGADRCGVRPENAPELAMKLSEMPGIELVGLMSYNGNIYGKPKDKMPDESRHEPEILMSVQKTLKENGIDLKVLSAASSLSSRFPKELKGITESRAGNYIYNDCTSLFSGLCTVEECALRVVATIISIPDKGRLIIDAGTKTLTSDGCSYRKEGYGYVVEYPDMEIYALNEEHGYVRYKDTGSLYVGQQISIIPNHACVISNVNEEVIGIKSDGTRFIIPVEARGKNR